MLTELSLIFWDCTYELLLDDAGQVKSHKSSFIKWAGYNCVNEYM